MSAIGDYIHLRTQNYNDWYNNRIKTTKGSSIASSYALVKQIGQDNAIISNYLLKAEQLQDRYNKLIYGKTKDGVQIHPFNDKETEQKVFNALTTALSDNFNKEVVNKVERNGDNIIITDQNNLLKKQIRRIEKIDFNKTAGYTQVNRKLQQLINHIKTGDWMNVGMVQSQVQNDLNTLEQIAKNLNDKSGFYVEYAKSIQTIRKIAEIYSKFPSLNEIRGRLFEFLIPLINMDLKIASQQEIVEAMLSANKGTETFNVYIDSQMGKQLAPDSLSVKNKLINFDIINNIRSKVDVVTSFPGTGQKLTISAKTTKEFKAIKLQDESNLYRILALSQNNDFATHVMNIFSTSDKDTESADPGDEELAIKGLRMLIAKSAIQGFNAFDKVDMLVINDEKSNFVHVYSAAVLIYGILATIETGQNQAGYGLSQSRINKLRQSFSQVGPEDRIQQTIQAYQGIKITTKVSASNINMAYETAKNLLAQKQ